MKKLTIVTPVYRGEKYLKNYIANILSLESRDQITAKVILNDPTPEEIRLINLLGRDERHIIEPVIVERESIAASINRGYRTSNTEFVAYADVDDLHPADAYENMLRTLDNAEITYGNYVNVAAQGNTAGELVNLRDYSKAVAINEPLFGPGHCFRREVLGKVGYWDEQLRSSGDYEWQIRSAHSCQVKKTKGIVTYYTRDGSMSASQTNWHRVENLLINLRYGIYDKIPPYLDCLPEMSKYDIFHVLTNGKYYSVEGYIDGYVELLKLNRNKIHTGYGFRRIASIFLNDIMKRLKD